MEEDFLRKNNSYRSCVLGFLPKDTAHNCMISNRWFLRFQLHPFRYLEFLLENLKNHQDETDRSFIANLLPWSSKLPEICKAKTK